MPEKTLEQNFIDKVRQLKLLPDDDKQILIDALQISYGHAEAKLSELSIFIRDAAFVKDGIYEYCNYEGSLYFKGTYDLCNSACFFNDEGKILYGSRHYLTHLHAFVESIDSCIHNLNSYNRDSAVDIGSNYIAIEKWFYTYGHFKDEAFSLYNFIKTHPWAEKKMPMIDYPTDNRLDTEKFTFNVNYQIIEKLIFGKRVVNMYKYENNLVKLNNLTLILNGFNADNFHSFPALVSKRIKRNIAQDAKVKKNPFLFITRSSSYRDIANKVEAEKYFADAGYKVVNPENLSYTELVNLMRHAKSVVMYYGSAMTNTVYVPKGAEIIILKSESYMEENLSLWEKVINEYSLDIKLVLSKNNIIEYDDVSEFLNRK